MNKPANQVACAADFQFSRGIILNSDSETVLDLEEYLDQRGIDFVRVSLFNVKPMQLESMLYIFQNQAIIIDTNASNFNIEMIEVLKRAVKGDKLQVPHSDPLMQFQFNGSIILLNDKDNPVVIPFELSALCLNISN